MLKLHRYVSTAVLVTAALVPATAAAQEFASPDARDRAEAAAVVQDLRSPDARDSAAPPLTAVQDLRSPDARDSALGTPAALAVAAPAPAPAPATASSTGGFDWGDAGIGAAGLLALVLLIGAGGLTAVHWWHSRGGHGHHPTPA